jgi:hypothetical protein
LGAPIVDRNSARGDPTTPSRASRTSRRAASTWTNRRVHRPRDSTSPRSRRLRRATAPLNSFRPPDAEPAPHTITPIPRDVPAGVRGRRRAHHARRSREAQPAKHHASARHGHQACPRVSDPRPRDHDSHHGDATDIRAAHRRLRTRRRGGGFEPRRGRSTRRRREARRRRAREGKRRGGEADAPRRSPGRPPPHIARGGIVRERWVGKQRRGRGATVRRTVTANEIARRDA